VISASDSIHVEVDVDSTDRNSIFKKFVSGHKKIETIFRIKNKGQSSIPQMMIYSSLR